MKKFLDTLINIYNIEELRGRIITTLTLLLVYRVGAQVVLPVINRENNKIQLDGNFKISLNEFGIKAPSFMLAEMQDLIDLSFSLEFVK